MLAQMAVLKTRVAAIQKGPEMKSLKNFLLLNYFELPKQKIKGRIFKNNYYYKNGYQLFIINFFSIYKINDLQHSYAYFLVSDAKAV